MLDLWSQTISFLQCQNFQLFSKAAQIIQEQFLQQMNQNKFQSDSGGTKIDHEDEDFLQAMNAVLDKHKVLAAKNNENPHLQNALKTLQQELNEAEWKIPGSAKQILESLFNN